MELVERVEHILLMEKGLLLQMKWLVACVVINHAVAQGA